MEFIIFILIGGISGWIAGLLFKGRGFGIFGNIVVGIVGGMLGGILFDILGIAEKNLIGEIVSSVIGAWILLSIIAAIKKN